MRWLVGLLLVSGCATVPPVPRFVALFEQRTGHCRLQVIKDTRSAACVMGIQCGRQAPTFLLVDASVCVP